jgi:hypothetical protein
VQSPPFVWGDRYDLVGLGVAAVVVVVLVVVGAPMLLSIVLGAAALNLTSYTLRRGAGIPQVTLWQR